MWKTLLLLPFVLSAVCASYEGHKLFNIFPKNEDHLELLNKLSSYKHVDVWHASAERYDLFVSPIFNLPLHAILQTSKCPFTVSEEDISQQIEEEAERLSHRSQDYDYEDFNDLEAINKELERLKQRCIGNFFCSLVPITWSHEERPIYLFHIEKVGVIKKTIWLDAASHAREWLTTATAMKFLRHLIEDYHHDENVRFLADNFRWRVVVVLNVDGYVYSWQKDRMWRKTRKPNKNPKCPGVDLNRNADSYWGVSGSSTNQCSQAFQGPSVASELETQALQKEFKRMGNNYLQVISMHAFGNMWLTPFGHVDNKTKKCYVAPDAQKSLRVANAAADAIQKVYNTRWTRGSICTTIYPASGSPMDYAKGVAGAMYGGAPELRGRHFIVEPKEIEPSYREFLAGMLASLRAICEEESILIE